MHTGPPCIQLIWFAGGLLAGQDGEACTCVHVSAALAGAVRGGRRAAFQLLRAGQGRGEKEPTLRSHITTAATNTSTTTIIGNLITTSTPVSSLSRRHHDQHRHLASAQKSPITPFTHHSSSPTNSPAR
ncbi:hypothetical protein DFH27DRAFT_609321 [Peziza echinospora]|nr:hypothetical protein DFH27DRAFT_609321 [Peziza echinospora]